MKALVLGGGSGSRLRPITHTSARQLLPVAGKPVLFYGLEAVRDAGITEAGIVVGDTAPAIRAAVGDGSGFGLEVTYIRQEAPLGLAHAVLVAREYLGGEDFVMYRGGVSLRSPKPSSGSLTTAARCCPRRLPVTGRTPGTSPACSRSAGWCWRAPARG